MRGFYSTALKRQKSLKQSSHTLKFLFRAKLIPTSKRNGIAAVIEDTHLPLNNRNPLLQNNTQRTQQPWVTRTNGSKRNFSVLFYSQLPFYSSVSLRAVQPLDSPLLYYGASLHGLHILTSLTYRCMYHNLLITETIMKHLQDSKLMGFHQRNNF